MSWIDTRKIQSERANLTVLFDKYVPTCLEAIKTTFKTVTPIPDNTMVQVTLIYSSFHFIERCRLSSVQANYFSFQASLEINCISLPYLRFDVAIFL